MLKTFTECYILFVKVSLWRPQAKTCWSNNEVVLYTTSVAGVLTSPDLFLFFMHLGSRWSCARNSYSASPGKYVYQASRIPKMVLMQEPLMNRFVLMWHSRTYNFLWSTNKIHKWSRPVVPAFLHSGKHILLTNVPPPHEEVAFIMLKRAIYNKFVQLREFGESDLGHSNEQTSQKKVRFRIRIWKCACMSTKL